MGRCHMQDQCDSGYGLLSHYHPRSQRSERVHSLFLLRIYQRCPVPARNRSGCICAQQYPDDDLCFQYGLFRYCINARFRHLFQGKSGTGKSTHSGLWLKHIPGCELLNDDNPIVHFNRETGKATVYGSPWSGKTPCYKNDSVPVGAFVRLEQAPMNEIQRESPARAFASLLPSCSNLKEVRELNNGVIETVKYLAAHTPVYFLKCLPDREAAEICFNTI